MWSICWKGGITINSAFQSLDPAKQKRIINAALQEFAEYGYEQASTNRIVQKAGIGKGMLFYYFNNKTELYLYLVKYAINVIKNNFFNLIDTNEPDFIERLRKLAHIKLKFFQENPHVSNFIGAVFISDEMTLPADLEKELNDLQKMGYSIMYDNIDRTLFRDDIDPEKAFQLIRWAIDGYQQDLLNRLKGKKITSLDFDPYWAEFYDYLNVLKTCFYKKQGDGQ
jgi:AcrR family transcriptional regulator